LPRPGRSVAGIAVDGTRLFIARRKPGGSLGGKWEFPGGKAEEGETDEAALKREYLEEFGVAVEVGPLLADAGFSHRGRPFSLNAYRIFFGSLDFRMSEHVEWRWASCDEIEAGGGFADSDLLLLPALRGAISTV